MILFFWKDQFNSFVCRGAEKPDALVFDLRNNGGGLLQGAVETSNLLLKPGA